MRGKGGERARMPVGAFLWSGPLNFARTKTRPRIASRVQEAIPESAWAGAIAGGHQKKMATPMSRIPKPKPWQELG
jgi:hypothetical protein